MIPYSFLDLAVVSEGDTIAQTLDKSVKTAQAADKNGFERYWFAEHHNIKSVTSSATSVLIGHIAGKTERIRVGSGGVMLPNHSPLVIAEHFGTLATLYPNRIDLGLGRAPGTDQITARALNPNFIENVQKFPSNVRQLQKYMSESNANAIVRAFPGEGTDVPVWILGSSTDSAYLSSELGLPYAFASHFAPTQMKAAFDIYENNILAKGKKPYKMAAVNVVIADSNEEAHSISTTIYRMFLGLIRNQRRYLQAPIPSMDGHWSREEEAHIKKVLKYSFVGTKEKVKQELAQFIQEFELDELMITVPVYHLKDKLFTIEKLAEIMKEL